MLTSRKLIVPGIISAHVIFTLTWPVLMYKKILKTLNNHWVANGCCVKIAGAVHHPFATKILHFKQLLLIYSQVEFDIECSVEYSGTTRISKTSRRNRFHQEEIPLAQLHGVVCLRTGVPGHESQAELHWVSISCVTVIRVWFF